MDHPGELEGNATLASRHGFVKPPVVTPRTLPRTAKVRGVTVDFIPTALCCYSIAKDAGTGQP